MGVPVDPIADFDAIFANLDELLSEITILSKTAKKLPAGKDKDAIISSSDTAARISEDIFRHLQSARGKLSRRFW